MGFFSYDLLLIFICAQVCSHIQWSTITVWSTSALMTGPRIPRCSSISPRMSRILKELSRYFLNTAFLKDVVLSFWDDLSGLLCKHKSDFTNELFSFRFIYSCFLFLELQNLDYLKYMMPTVPLPITSIIPFFLFNWDEKSSGILVSSNV